jgi:hypothetical protein
MKKPLVIRKPKTLENNRTTGSGFEKIGDILNKLEPQQLISLANSVTNFATVGFEYAAECQKTKQVEINAHVRIREIEAGRERASEEHKQVMAQIQKKEREDERQFKKDMEDLEIRAGELEKKDKSIHRILDLLEAGKISEDKLVDIIHELKQ